MFIWSLLRLHVTIRLPSNIDDVVLLTQRFWNSGVKRKVGGQNRPRKDSYLVYPKVSGGKNDEVHRFLTLGFTDFVLTEDFTSWHSYYSKIVK